MILFIFHSGIQCNQSNTRRFYLAATFPGCCGLAATDCRSSPYDLDYIREGTSASAIDCLHVPESRDHTRVEQQWQSDSTGHNWRSNIGNVIGSEYAGHTEIDSSIAQSSALASCKYCFDYRWFVKLFLLIVIAYRLSFRSL